MAKHRRGPLTLRQPFNRTMSLGISRLSLQHTELETEPRSFKEFPPESKTKIALRSNQHSNQNQAKLLFASIGLGRAIIYYQLGISLAKRPYPKTTIFGNNNYLRPGVWQHDEGLVFSGNFHGRSRRGTPGEPNTGALGFAAVRAT